MPLFAMWAAGTAAQIELNTAGRGGGEDIASRGWTAVEGLREAGHVRYKCQGNTSYTFHFPIATPVIVGNMRASFIRAMAFYKAPAGVALNKVEVFDGALTVFSQAGLNGTGDHPPLGSPSAFIDGVTAFPMPGLAVSFGCDIALTFHFASEQEVLLYGAGIDFNI